MVVMALTLPANILGLLHSQLHRSRTPVSLRSLSLILVILSKAPAGPSSSSHCPALPSRGTHLARPMCKPTAWPSCVTTPSSRKCPILVLELPQRVPPVSSFLAGASGTNQESLGWNLAGSNLRTKIQEKRFASSSTERKKQCEGPPYLTSLTKTYHTRVKQNKGKTRYYCCACEGSPAKSHSAEATWERKYIQSRGWIYNMSLFYGFVAATPSSSPCSIDPCLA